MIRKTAKYPRGYPFTKTQGATANRHRQRCADITATDVERIEAAARKRARKGRSAD